jgi:MFS family permease
MGEVRAPAPRSSFARYWAAAAVSSLGSAVTAVAMPVLVVQLLGATPFEVGVVNAAQYVPYALLALVAGAYTDRWRRKPVLVWASVGRALSLGAVPVLWLTGVLQIWMLVIALLLFGAFSVFGFAGQVAAAGQVRGSGANLVMVTVRLPCVAKAASWRGSGPGGRGVSMALYIASGHFFDFA